MPSRKTLIISTVAAVAIVGVVFAATRKPVVIYETEAVTRGSVVHEVTVTGSIAPFQKIELQPEASGKVSRVHVTEGSEVKAGQVLLEIDARDIQARIASQRAAVDSARARLAELVAGATPQELASAEASVTSARTKRDSSIAAKADAQVAYANAVAKTDAQLSAKLDSFLLGYDDALTAAKDAVERLTSPLFTSSDFLTFSTNNAVAQDAAVSTRGTAKARLADLAALVASVKATGTVSSALGAYAAAVSQLSAVKVHLEADRTVLGFATDLSSSTLATYQANVGAALSAVDGALQSLSSAKSALDLQSQLNAAEVSGAQSALTSATFAVTAADNAVAQAEADLALRQSGNRAEVIAAQRAAVASQEATLSGLYADLAKRKIVAPLDAVVTEVTVHVGETASPSQPAIVLNAHGKFEIVANVSEVDIAKVRVGQAVAITLDAFPPSEKWAGKVASVDPAEKVVEGVIFYETKFVFDQEDERVRSGMTANLSIETDRRDDVLRVPLRAVRETQGKAIVDVLVNGAPEERQIVIGVEDDEYVEVISGVAEGELVVTGSSEDK